jgi:hypothetical protein
MYGVFRTLHDMFRRVHVYMYPHTIIYFVSCTLDLCSPYVASEMTNSKLVPKNQKNSKKSKKIQKSLNFPKKPQKSQNLTKKSLILAFFLANLIFFLKFLAFLANFGFLAQFWHFLAFLEKNWISCSLHIGYKNRT